MATETQVVNQIVADIKRHPDKYKGWASRALRWAIMDALHKDDLPGAYHYHPRDNGGRDRQYMIARLERRIQKKLGQPFRRKKRGPFKRRAAGKNEVTRRR